MFNPNQLQNDAYKNTLKKLIFEITKDNYKNHEDILERMSSSLNTKKDYEQIISLITEIYRKGFDEAIKQQKDSLKNLGFKVIEKENNENNLNDENRIFKKN